MKCVEDCATIINTRKDLSIKQLDDVETAKENEADFLGVPFESVFPDECQKYRWSKFRFVGMELTKNDRPFNVTAPLI